MGATRATRTVASSRALWWRTACRRRQLTSWGGGHRRLPRPKLLNAGESAKVSDETVQRLLTAGARLYANKMELEDRWFGPFISQESVTATDVVMNVCEMLRFADLNIFDLAMWYRRPKPGDRDP
jgi:hypothetical protein